MHILEWPYYGYQFAKATSGLSGYLPLAVGFGLPYYLYGSPMGGDLQSMAMWYGVGGLAEYATEMLLVPKSSQ